MPATGCRQCHCQCRQQQQRRCHPRCHCRCWLWRHSCLLGQGIDVRCTPRAPAPAWQRQQKLLVFHRLSQPSPGQHMGQVQTAALELIGCLSCRHRHAGVFPGRGGSGPLTTCSWRRRSARPAKEKQPTARRKARPCAKRLTASASSLHRAKRGSGQSTVFRGGLEVVTQVSCSRVGRSGRRQAAERFSDGDGDGWSVLPAFSRCWRRASHRFQQAAAAASNTAQTSSATRTPIVLAARDVQVGKPGLAPL